MSKKDKKEKNILEEKGRDTCGLTGQMCPLWTTITLLAQHCTRISRSLHSGEKQNVIIHISGPLKSAENI